MFKVLMSPGGNDERFWHEINAPVAEWMTPPNAHRREIHPSKYTKPTKGFNRV